MPDGTPLYSRSGVHTMSSDDFISRAQEMNQHICNQPAPWQESVCDQLYSIYEQRSKRCNIQHPQSKYDPRLVRYYAAVYPSA